MTEATYCCWRSRYGGLKLLDWVDTRLKRAMADLTLEWLILKGETTERVNASGNWYAPRVVECALSM